MIATVTGIVAPFEDVAVGSLFLFQSLESVGAIAIKAQDSAGKSFIISLTEPPRNGIRLPAISEGAPFQGEDVYVVEGAHFLPSTCRTDLLVAPSSAYGLGEIEITKSGSYLVCIESHRQTVARVNISNWTIERPSGSSKFYIGRWSIYVPDRTNNKLKSFFEFHPN